MTPRASDDEDAEDDRRQATRRTVDAISLDGTPWQVKAAIILGAPTIFAGYLIYALVSGIVPAILSMQTTVTSLTAAVAEMKSDHQTAKQQNERILTVLRASCVNQAQDNPARERCLQ